MGEVLSCIEHTRLPIVPSRKSGDLALEPKHCRLLSGLEHALPAGAIRWEHKAVKCSQYCGILQLGDLTLEILPKIYGKEENPGACREALVRMLYKARLFKSHKGGPTSINLQKHTLLDIFILHFCQELQAQTVRGKLRHYIVCEENLNVLRGKLLIDQQFKRNAAHRERLFCSYDEWSDDILINQIIKYTLGLLLPKARSVVARKTVAENIMFFDQVSDRPISVQDIDGLVFNRTTARFKPLLDQCRIFISGMNPDIVTGNTESFSLLFDMNRLFESWVAAILRPVAHRQGLRLKEQGPRRFMAFREDLNQPVFQMKPDISFVDEKNRTMLIADAKWKILDSSELRLGISQADMYQVQSYANRYSVKNVVLVYPAQRGLDQSYEFVLHGGYETRLQVSTVDIV